MIANQITSKESTVLARPMKRQVIRTEGKEGLLSPADLRQWPAPTSFSLFVVVQLLLYWKSGKFRYGSKQYIFMRNVWALFSVDDGLTLI